MGTRDFTLSIAIPTYGREQVLLDTVGYLLELAKGVPGYAELILIDQTRDHAPATERQLATLRRLTEQYCVVMQTLRKPPAIDVSWQKA